MGLVVSLLGLYCRAGCDAKKVSAALTYLPPHPPSYEFIEKVKKVKKSLPDVFGNPEISPAEPTAETAVPEKPDPIKEFSDARLLEYGVMASQTANLKILGLLTVRGQRIAAFLFENKQAEYTIIYSHGNATDIGEMFPFFADLRRHLGVQVLAYDYSGYGCSSGTPSEDNTYADIDAAFRYSQQHGGPAGKKNIILGQSVGSGPTCWLAAREAAAGRIGTDGGVHAVILHSPCKSLIRVLGEGVRMALACWDGYPNVDRIRYFRNYRKDVPGASEGCPVLILHGTQDEVVPFYHGQDLYQACPENLRREPWWVEGAGHNDIFERDPQEYFKRVRAFLESIES
eukprot:TRINITY_DN2950_c0_g1::TRINITY_DN2950_c0_g1_i1::g.4025::m.4025 TRINITY_DN2950_c0_g1::TRINITY_DN2950_c0_g1_i1::g.4025  ORF type:complete len:343 (-),score=54.54,sp/Q5ZJX1/AB17C_CHICK/35.35/1e-49,Abhydrolase_5/PF12695.2/2e-24,Abhydrolase_6/PF12697.2/2.7e-14,Abhydrolase_1/PF00561.15/6.9e-06,Abhydrolase_1/PF00561.15/0.069,Peptidase_S9/PF00326.16/0.00016,Hydrolase_4/PF12146.3/0.0018,Abhydrolase_2/PF02230.11/4e+03,Abhydrolase_2/PF02230.11/0.034,LIP/PF03583.9/3.1e+02,LIP/PF03583.9/0.13,FSH1/PF03959.8/0.